MKVQYISNAAEREFKKDLPKEHQESFVKAIQDVLEGRRPSMAFKPLKTVGKGVIELIINGSPAFRVLYVAKYNDILYILHSFTKTTEGVHLPAMKVAKKRYKDIPK